MSNVVKILKNHKLRITDCRVSVLSYFLDKKYALTHANLEEEFSNKFDRVTLYRTLSAFEESGLVHKVPDASESAKFAVCSENCSDLAHYDNHIHFKCRKCGKTECISDIPIPKIQLPTGYIPENAELLVSGQCKKCN
ncbi:MAG: transcriptional repressor [Chitinophagaceae bacterium]|nr:MAG: transcriptional repressor [Chitinophagaceae bacterium]